MLGLRMLKITDTLSGALFPIHHCPPSEFPISSLYNLQWSLLLWWPSWFFLVFFEDASLLHLSTCSTSSSISIAPLHLSLALCHSSLQWRYSLPCNGAASLLALALPCSSLQWLLSILRPLHFAMLPHFISQWRCSTPSYTATAPLLPYFPMTLLHFILKWWYSTPFLHLFHSISPPAPLHLSLMLLDWSMYSKFARESPYHFFQVPDNLLPFLLLKSLQELGPLWHDKPYYHVRFG